eukprot:1795599-Prymnesium_polylepis.1
MDGSVQLIGCNVSECRATWAGGGAFIGYAHESVWDSCSVSCSSSCMCSGVGSCSGCTWGWYTSRLPAE